jgi:two-component system sensor kinase FixL
VLVQEDAQDGTRLLCSGDDVTDTRRAEVELRESHERMTHVSRLATMGEMASSIAHEINQPLAAITNYAQAGARLLTRGGSDLTDVGEALQQIAEQALRAGDIIRRLRSLVGHRSTAREPSDLNAVVAEIEPLARADARATHVALSFEFAPQLPNLTLDRIQIQHVVLILVRNSIDALSDAPSGQRSVSVRIGATNEAIQILVQDNGPGIAPTVLERLFQPFVTTKENGTGLGLAIARTIIEAHRGSLEYRDMQPHGACFVATLPADPHFAS